MIQGEAMMCLGGPKPEKELGHVVIPEEGSLSPPLCHKQKTDSGPGAVGCGGGGVEGERLVAEVRLHGALRCQEDHAARPPCLLRGGSAVP